MEQGNGNEPSSAKVRAIMILRSWTGRTLKEKWLADSKDAEEESVFQGFVEIVPQLEVAEVGLGGDTNSGGNKCCFVNESHGYVNHNDSTVSLKIGIWSKRLGDKVQAGRGGKETVCLSFYFFSQSH